jgi:hypothetical protein
MRLIGVVVATAISVAVLAPAALAQDPTVGVYGGEGGNVQGQLDQGGAAAGGVLPFTGIDLAFAFGAGLVLIAVGVVLRRVSRRSV